MAEPAAPADSSSAQRSPRVELSPGQCAAQLAEQFPALFGPHGPPKPIKLRIHADIQQRAPGQYTRKALSLFLHRHTTSTAYLKALLTAPHRFDLDGAAAGEIAAEHREAARLEVERRRALVAARRPAPQTPRPPAATQRPPAAAPRPRPAASRPNAPTAQAAAKRAARQRPAAPPASETPVQDAAGRERALLLRAWESSTLTKANFCALKRISPDELDAHLALARQERETARSGTGA